MTLPGQHPVDLANRDARRAAQIAELQRQINALTRHPAAGGGGGGGAPSGPAGGVLSGTYPNPGFAVDMATQAELDAAIAGVGFSYGSPNVQTGSYTLVSGDKSKVVEINSTSIATVTFPSGVFSVGDWGEIHRYGPNLVGAAAAGGVTLNAPGGKLGILDRYGSLHWRCRAANEFEITGSGDLTTHFTGYQGLILGTPGIQSFWRMGETTSTFADQKGVLALAAPTGGGFTRGVTGLVTGDANAGFRRGTSTGGLSTASADAYAYRTTTPFSVEFIVKWFSFTSGDTNALLRNTNFTTDNWGFYHDTTTTTTGLKFGRNSSAQSIALANTTLALNTRYHVVGTYDGTNMRLYVNGAQVGATTASGTFTGVTGTSLWSGGTSSTDWELDEIATYSVALDATTIATHATAMG